jgi:hypothetical protein
MKRSNKYHDCCKQDNKKESQAFWLGIVYGLVPHIGCIAFIVLAVFGATASMAFLKPALLNPYFFYILIGLSFIFATISATIYLKINTLLSLPGIKRKWKYLTTLYFSTILINVFMFMLIFPYATNAISSQIAVNKLFSQTTQSTLVIQVAIPCSGHAPLITEELYKMAGVKNVKFQFPNKFIINCDYTKTSKEQILSLPIFNTYKAAVLDTQADFITTSP